MTMSISMYDFSIPVLTRGLTTMSAVLDKAAAQAAAKKFDTAVLAQARLFPDMYPLVRQVQIACDTAKGAAARLAGVEVPKHEDTEETFAELKARIAKTDDFIQSVKPAQIDGSKEKNIHLKLGPREVDYKGMQYLLGHAIPNFYFHVTTAYDILRHNGVELAKRDYLANPSREAMNI